MNTRTKHARRLASTAKGMFKIQYRVKIIAEANQYIAVDAISEELTELDEEWEIDYPSYGTRGRIEFELYITTTQRKKLTELLDKLVEVNNKKFETLGDWEAFIVEETEELIEEKNKDHSSNTVTMRPRRVRKVSDTGRPDGCEEHGIQSDQCGYPGQQFIQSMDQK